MKKTTNDIHVFLPIEDKEGAKELEQEVEKLLGELNKTLFDYELKSVRCCNLGNDVELVVTFPGMRQGVKWEHVTGGEMMRIERIINKSYFKEYVVSFNYSVGKNRIIFSLDK